MREAAPAGTRRAEAFRLWTRAPMPMVTLIKTLDVTRLVRLSRRGRKFNMLLCWCAGRAASRMEDFYLLPVGERLARYDRLAVSAVVETADGGISTCDIPVSDGLDRFEADYLRLTGQVRASGTPHDLGEDCMVLGTSALPRAELDGAVNLYAGFYNNPFLIWGRYRRKGLRWVLPVSFQFHHAQMDGVPAGEFLDRLQEEIRRAPGRAL